MELIEAGAFIETNACELWAWKIEWKAKKNKFEKAQNILNILLFSCRISNFFFLLISIPIQFSNLKIFSRNKRNVWLVSQWFDLK